MADSRTRIINSAGPIHYREKFALTRAFVTFLFALALFSLPHPAFAAIAFGNVTSTEYNTGGAGANCAGSV